MSAEVEGRSNSHNLLQKISNFNKFWIIDNRFEDKEKRRGRR
jgi:hypothetical protein